MTFYELEKECKKRRKHFFIKFFLILLLFILVISVAYYLFYYKNNLTKKERPIQKIKKVEHQQSKINLKKDKNITNKEKVKKYMSNNVPIIKFDLNLKELNDTDVKTITNNNITKTHKEKKELNKSKLADNQKILTINNLPSYDTCIKLAKNFYKIGDYKNALKWAKSANIQNNTLAESWILTAKSLYKLHKKDEAIKILKIYYKYTKNKQILNLIDNIKNNNIR